VYAASGSREGMQTQKDSECCKVMVEMDFIFLSVEADTDEIKLIPVISQLVV